MHRSRTLAAVAAASVVTAIVSTTTPPASATSSAFATRVAGASRYATAAAIAEAAFPNGATTAVLARGDEFADALAGAALAGDVGGPVLLTPSDQLDQDTSAALDSLGVTDVRVLGGSGAITDAVVSELEAEGRAVTRVAGADRYATAAAVASVMGAGDVDGTSTVIVASGETFPDALSVGPVAAWARIPILLTTASSLPPDTADALRSIDADRVLVLGGSAAVSESVVAGIESLGADVERLAGTSRAGTAVVVADFALDVLGWDAGRALVARSDVFADGLAGGPLGAAVSGPVLLTSPASLDSETRGWLAAHEPSIDELTVLGGDAAVPTAVVDAAVVAAGGAPSAGEGALGLTPGDRALVPYGSPRACTLAVPGGATVHVRVVSATDVGNADDGSVTFADGDRDGVADLATTAAAISTVDDRVISPPSSSEDVTSPTTFELSAASYANVVTVAFVDGADGTPSSLDLDDTGHAVDEVAVGCAATFAPDESPAGTYAGVTVGVADPLADVIVDSGEAHAFAFESTDAFHIEGATASVDDFADAISAGDTVDITYDTGTSSFNITSDVVRAPGTAVGVTKSLDAIGTYDDVEVAFAVPAWNGGGTRYAVTRVRTELADGECSGAVVATATNEGSTTSSPFLDLSVPDGCYIYRVIAVSSSGATATGGFSDPIRVPGAAAAEDTSGPRSTYAAVTTNGGSTSLGNGDVITIAFDEALAPPSSASISVRSDLGVSASLTAGSGATFSLNAASVTVGGASRAPNTVLTIQITNDPASPVTLPVEVTSASGLTDAGATPWDIAASPDTQLESTSP